MVLEQSKKVFPIIPAGDRLTEPEALEALIAYLDTCPYKEAKFKKIWFELPGKWVKLTEEDRNLGGRIEAHWHTVVRNISAHLGEKPNHDSRIKKRPGGDGFQLTSYEKKGK